MPPDSLQPDPGPPDSLPRALLSWSSGKDSAWALQRLRDTNQVELIGLFTTVNQAADRVAMHGVRREVLEAQAAAVGLPLYTADLPWPCSNEDYESITESRLRELAETLGLTHVVFGDLYLEDIREYRERQMNRLGLQPLFPLWGLSTSVLAREMVEAGLEARLACVDSKQCPDHFCGWRFDEDLLDRLPDSVDPCGENGEFHTVVTNGLMFTRGPGPGTGRAIPGRTVRIHGLRIARAGRPENLVRIASLLPSATEIVCALGLEEQLVGVSHSCDYPPTVKNLPRLTRTTVPVEASSREIDTFVREYLGSNNALYQLDVSALEQCRPDLVVSQRLCDVCAVSADEVDAVMCRIPGQPRHIDLNPGCMADIFDDIAKVAQAAGVPDAGDRLVASLQERIRNVSDRSHTIDPKERPRLAVIEWLDPPFNSGHWMPELVEAAGAVDVLGPRGARSFAISWDDVLAARPDVVLISVCGFDLERSRRELELIQQHPGWLALREQVDEILLIDGDAFFVRPGPRLVDALESLARTLHPELHPGIDVRPGAARIEEIRTLQI